MGEWKKTQCAKCAVSCGLEMEIENNKIVNVRPDPDSPRTKGYCCRKGRSSKYFQENPDRLKYPMKRVDNEYVRISWEQAYKEIAEKANTILKDHGPRVFALAGCALASAQAQLAVARPLMNAIGTKYIYNPIGLEFMGDWWSHGKIIGDQNGFAEADDHKVDVFIFWGSNSYVSHQIANARSIIREISEDPDRMVITVDPRLSETARMSDMHIAPRPGTDSLLLRAMIALILKKGWQDQEYLDKRSKDFDKIKPWFENFDIDNALRVCRVPYKQIEDFCRILTTKKWGCHRDLGLFFGRHNTLSSYLSVILEAVCGVLLVDGGAIIHDDFTPRGITADENDPDVWRTVATNRFPVLETYPEGVLAKEIMSDNPEHLRVLFASATNLVRTFPDTKELEKAIKKLDLFVCIEICETETTILADYVLPAKTGYETYDFTTFQGNYPDIDCTLKQPVLDSTDECKENSIIWIEIADAMGLIPKLPKSLYKAADKAVKTGDRIPYFIKLLKYILLHKKYEERLPLIVGKTLGMAMGSVTKSIMWAALLTSPLAGRGICERAGFGPGNKHRFLKLIPMFRTLLTMDNVFQAVEDTPQGVRIGISERGKNFEDHIKHPDKRLHLYCDEINEYIKRITPELEEAAIATTKEFPMLLSSGNHADSGHNTTMRNPGTYKYRKPYVLSINPDDSKAMGISDGQLVRVTTKAGSACIPVEYTYRASKGYAIFPHHFGLTVNGVTVGTTSNELSASEDIDELTGNAILRYVPCRIEAV